MAALESREHATPVEAVPLYRRWPVLQYGIAAAITLLLAVTALLWWGRPVTHTTAFGEKRTLVLPDQSVVTLNGNSSLSYPRRWDEAEAREVTLKGEAFFSVRHTRRHTRFFVLTPTASVEVLGTKFNVSDRKGRTRVVLVEGKVEITDRRRGVRPKLVMQPGQLAEVSAGSAITRRTVKPEVYASWKDNQLTFEDTSLRDIAALLEANYGFTVAFAHPALAERKFNGVFPADDLSLLFEALSTSLGIRITQREKALTFSARP
jgi:ferric-dicitrate binding protein FerR (iron transport regulator)